MTRLLTMLAAVLLTASPLNAQTKNLRIYVVDVEGGQASLFVAPGGQSLLVDMGWPGDRDADRIVKAVHDAGLTKLDTVLITHYHTDHVGGVANLAGKIAIGRFLDHGPNTEMDHGVTEKGYADYQKVLADKNIPHQTVHAGDTLDVLPGVKVQVASGNGDIVTAPLFLPPGAKAKLALNPACAASPEKPAENSENDRSLGLLLTFGKTRILDLGDLTWNIERGLVCPVNKIGQVDLYIASHHGFDRSGSPALLNTIAPRVAVIDNGGHKGADANAWQIIASSPRIGSGGERIWQLHTAEAKDAHNVPEARIANLTSRPDPGYGLQLTVLPGGSMIVRNERTGDSTTIPVK